MIIVSNTYFKVLAVLFTLNIWNTGVLCSELQLFQISVDTCFFDFFSDVYFQVESFADI